MGFLSAMNMCLCCVLKEIFDNPLARHIWIESRRAFLYESFDSFLALGPGETDEFQRE